MTPVRGRTRTWLTMPPTVPFASSSVGSIETTSSGLDPHTLATWFGASAIVAEAAMKSNFLSDEWVMLRRRLNRPRM